MWLTFLAMVAVAAGKAVDWARSTPKEIVAAILDGDQRASAWLVRKHWGGMMRVANGLLRSEGVAAEVVQETWEAVFKGLEKFRGDSSLSTWIFRILVNRARRVGKKEARSIPFASLGRQGEESERSEIEDEFTARGHWRSPVHGWTSYDPEEQAINRQGLQILARGLERLPENQRLVVALRDVEGLDSDEVCELLDITSGNQRQLLHRGRTRLRRMLEEAEVAS